jgi:glutamine---fructose-6-phosphate transaminase (isomerizing)
LFDKTKMFDVARTGPTSDQPTDGRNVLKTGTAGSKSCAEILSQPQCWSDCLAAVEGRGSLSAISEKFRGTKGWLFIGCGSSYYVALAAAATMATLTGRRSQAIPASELLLYPELTLAAAGDSTPILISRSGRTSEVLKARELLKSRSIPMIAITCARGQPLEQQVPATIVLPHADEQSTVMTRSFSSMLLVLQQLAALIARDSEFGHSLHRMPVAAAPVLQTLPAEIKRFVDRHQFADYVCLAQGPFYGLACEYALKVTEMSVSYAQSYHTLEFRHGPKSIVSADTLLIFLLSDSGYQAEREALEEMKSLGGTTLVVANKADARVRAASDLLVELSLDVPELVRLAPTLFAGQLLGLYTGLRKGLDPDSPRNLSRVVALDDIPSSGNPQKTS